MLSSSMYVSRLAFLPSQPHSPWTSLLPEIMFLHKIIAHSTLTSICKVHTLCQILPKALQIQRDFIFSDLSDIIYFPGSYIV